MCTSVCVHVYVYICIYIYYMFFLCVCHLSELYKNVSVFEYEDVSASLRKKGLARSVAEWANSCGCITCMIYKDLNLPESGDIQADCETYQKKHWPIQEEQLMKAGYRLAALIKMIIEGYIGPKMPIKKEEIQESTVETDADNHSSEESTGESGNETGNSSSSSSSSSTNNTDSEASKKGTPESDATEKENSATKAEKEQTQIEGKATENRLAVLINMIYKGFIGPNNAVRFHMPIKKKELKEGKINVVTDAYNNSSGERTETQSESKTTRNLQSEKTTNTKLTDDEETPVCAYPMPVFKDTDLAEHHKSHHKHHHKSHPKE
eukprot:GHVR01107845.1.p1 GENE.GHVR01107845.1~~GHVR01107845.1.p1  ORF type:complete len:322 (+),score=51.18 GHVR01107845.1:1010-1975(+)